ncbi:MAG: polyprenyl synthetase family protein [Deltaproteobacteria bacterium]|jgi:octaprenyl-diphosphate synthase|nr:polyprenyl synthetase family protein [Deltaproteobacteria bacterium]
MSADLLTSLSPLTEQINETMKEILTEDSSILGEVSLYNFMGGGKRLRPLIFCLCHKALGGEVDAEILRLSTTFEFLHMASLLHDDIVDQADTRRGRPAAHHIFGIPETIMAADYLLAKASGLALVKRDLNVADIITDVMKCLSLGELWELKAKNKVELEKSEYIEIILHKTATLIEGVAWSAAVLNNAPNDKLISLRYYGRWTGLAFQIMDDILDYKANPNQLGKPVGQDLEEGRITLPFILARNELKGKDLDRLLALGALVAPTAQEKAEAVSLVEKVGGIELAHRQAQALSELAVSSLSNIPESQAREDLEKLAQYTVSRDR